MVEVSIWLGVSSSAKLEVSEEAPGVLMNARNGLIKNESGNIGLILALGLLAVFFYTKAYLHFGFEVSELIRCGAIVISAMLSLFAILCMIHMKVIGGLTNRELKNEVMARLKKMEKLVWEAKYSISAYEAVMVKRMNRMTRKGIDRFSILKRLVRALEDRADEVRMLIAIEDSVSLMEAYELAEKRLSLSDNCYSSLIDTDPIAPLAPYEWESALKNLQADVEEELREVRLVA